MLKLLFNLELTQPSSSGKRHGGGKYGEVVFKKIVKSNMPVYAFYDSKKWFNPEIMNLIKKHNIPLFDKQNQNLEDTIKVNNIDRLYLPMEVYDGSDHIHCCEVYGTIHGTRAVELQYDYMMHRYKSLSFRERAIFLIKHYLPSVGYKHAKEYFSSALVDNNFHFIMVSNHSATSLRSYFPKECFGREIPVFYSPSTSTTRELTRKCDERYYLLVSANRWEKNCLRGIIALDRLFSAGYLDSARVKITGVKSADAFRYKIKNPEKFEFCGYVDDDELEQLYHDAYAFIYPSENEGFGYPPMESMRYGVPALVSAHTSISEVCEGAVLYFNPFSIEEIMARILYIENKDVHDKYSVLASNQYIKITKRQIDDLDKLVEFLYRKKT